MVIRYPLAHLAADPIIARFVPYVAEVDDVLSPEECAAEVARIEALEPTAATINLAAGHTLDARVRNNDRVTMDDLALAARLWERLAPAVPAEWRAIGLNERFRGYRYVPGQRFAPHYDGSVVLEGRHSVITLLVYLNGLNGDCQGGETRLIQWNLTVVPRPGMALLFQHDVYHEGALVTAGRKYVLRSDVMVATTRQRQS